MKRLAIITSHPIQYNAPLFKLLSERKKLVVKVFYTWGKSSMENKFDPDFGRVIDWDIPLLDGYEYEFLDNQAAKRGSHHFKGIDNPQIIHRIDSFAPDAVLIFGWAFKSHLKALRHYSKTKMIIFRGDSTLLDKTSRVKSLLRSLVLKWIYFFVDYALYTGKNNYAYFKRAGLLDSQLIYAPHAIDNNRFDDRDSKYTEKAKSCRNSMGIDPEKTVFLFAGKLEEKKDVGTLLTAFEKSGLRNKAVVVIVGNGKMEKALKEMVRNNDSIHFIDFKNQSEMPVIYRMGDVFVLPSKGPGETWGLAVNEAMASEKPVIVSDRCGCAVELVDESQNGYIFNAEDIDDLTQKLKLMAGKGKDDLREMGKKGGIKIAGYSFEKFCEATESLLNHEISKA